VSNQSFTISEFCAAEKISRQHLYNLWHRAEGPAFYLVGRRRRITEAQRREWHQRMTVAPSKGGE
jgi:hypothetical protein